MTEPKQKPGKSKQDYGTPRDFLAAVERRFGAFAVDLAARADNAKAPTFVTPEEDSLKVPWAERFASQLCWLNPPFADIDPWAAKCLAEGSKGLGIVMLTPASVGSCWFAEHVHQRAQVLAVAPRLTFEGTKDPYPKDCMLSVWGRGAAALDVWRWRA